MRRTVSACCARAMSGHAATIHRLQEPTEARDRAGLAERS